MDERQSEILDNQGRELIINELHKNLFVIAGAGSGKTSMLVSRMVAMVEDGFDISKICAITFTKKAAAEFLDRFQSKLKERSIVTGKPEPVYPGSLPTPTEETAERCRKALERIDLCFTGTIDSFCNLVLSEYPNNAKIPSSSSVIQDDEALEFYKNEYKNVANDDKSSLKEKFDSFNLLFSNGAEVFANSINDVIDISHLDVVFERPTKSIFKSFKEDLIDKYYQRIKHDLEIINRLDATDCSDTKPDYVNNLNTFKADFRALTAEWTLNNINRLKKDIKKHVEGLRFVTNPELSFIEFKKMARSDVYCFDTEGVNIFEFIKDVNAFTYKYAMDFLCSIAQVIRDDLKKQGKLTFSEYLLTFRDMVKEDMKHGMKLINHIRSKHSYFLIDESQDTSPIQTELFFLLTSSQKADSLKECKPIPGSLFIVGDPKQSIYEFRGADVEAYLNTKDMFEKVLNQNENRVVYLTKNFRSTSELCEYFNKLFADFDNYEPIPIECIKKPVIEKECLSGVYSCPSYLTAINEIVDKQEIFDKRLLEKEEREIANNSFKGIRTYGFKKVKYQDIMILTRVTTYHNSIIKELNNRNIPVYCEGKYTISENDAVRTIYSIYGYVIGEEGQLFNLLTSPLFNLKSEQLIGFSVDKLDNTDAKELFNSFEQLKGIDNPIELYDSISNRLKLYKYIDILNMEYVMFVGEKLKNAYQNGLIVDAKDGGAFLKQYINEVVDRTMNLVDSPNAIYLANLHKVKGLERPIVIIVESGKNNNDKPNKYMDNTNNKGYLFKTSEFHFGKLSFYDIEAGDDLTNELNIATEKHKTEARRLDYVAVTRARNALIIENARSGSVWANIRPDDIEELPRSEEEDKNVVSTANPFSFEVQIDFNQNRSYQIKKPSQEAKLPTIALQEEPIDEERDENSDSLIKGTIVHKLLEMVITSKQGMNKETIINIIISQYSLEDERYKTMLENVYDCMTNGGYKQANGQRVDLLKEISNAECYCEIPFSFKEGYQIWQGEIDLLYIKDGRYFIVDYKTNADESGLEEEYKDQLAAYKKALKINLGVDAEAYIYHIDIR